jgi:hypothetical protein
MHDRGRAHDAGLERHVQRGAAEPIRTESLSTRAQCFDLRVRGGVVRADRPVRSHGQYGVVPDEDRADGHLTRRLSTTRRLERETHVVDIAAISQGRSHR